MTASSRSKIPSSLLSLSLYPNPQTQKQKPSKPHIPSSPNTHQQKNSKSSCSSSFICCLSHSSGVHKTQMSVRLSVTPPPLQFKIQEQKKPGIFNLNRPNPKLDPTLCYSNSSTSRYPRTKFSKEKKTGPYVRHPLTISQPQKKSFLQISELLSHHSALDFYAARGSKEGRKR